MRHSAANSRHSARLLVMSRRHFALRLGDHYYGVAQVRGGGIGHLGNRRRRCRPKRLGYASQLRLRGPFNLSGGEVRTPSEQQKCQHRTDECEVFQDRHGRRTTRRSQASSVVPPRCMDAAGLPYSTDRPGGSMLVTSCLYVHELADAGLPSYPRITLLLFEQLVRFINICGQRPPLLGRSHGLFGAWLVGYE